ncbi:MAG: PHP domain-containing protein [Acidobacteria bacterium]|nr:PHP domain-containing protein [Acidobacteriota bacterium]
MLKSATHIHSTYSDGEYTLAELRQVYLAAGYNFVCLTDHAEFFTSAKLQAYIEECAALSDERFRFFAGLEFGCENRMHILGLGVTALVNTVKPQEVIQHIRKANGVSVIAHPMDSMFEWIEAFDLLPDGIETWNSKYDGQYAPRPATFDLLNRLQRRKPEMRAFYGQDLHWKNQYRGLFYQMDEQNLLLEGVLDAFRQGRFVALKDHLQLSSDGQLSMELKSKFGRINSRYHKKRQFIKTLKRTFDRLGIHIPDNLKAQFRRVF